MSGATEAVASCDLLIFAYPVYDFLVPSQLHRFIELLKASGADFTGVLRRSFLPRCIFMT